MHRMHGIAPADRLLTASELAVVLAVSRSKLSRLSTSGEIPCVRIGERSVRYRLSDVQEALGMNPRTERNKAIREAAMERAKETVVFEVPGQPGVCVVVLHPGQRFPIDKEDAEFPTWLRQNFGCSPHQLTLLSDSWGAPAPYSLDAEVARARHELAELEAQRSERDRIGAQLVADAHQKVAELEDDRDADRTRTAPKATSATKPS